MAQEKMDINKKKVRTPPFRMSFPHLFEKHAYKNNEPKFELTMLFDSQADLTAMRKAADNALVERWGADKKRWPKNLIMPFRDGDEKPDLEGYEGCIFVKANTKRKVPVVGPKKDPDTKQFPRLEKDDDEIYAGCRGKANLLACAYPFDTKEKNPKICGVKFILQSVQKVGEGDRFGGVSSNPDAEFDDVEDSSDDATSYSDSESTTEESYGF